MRKIEKQLALNRTELEKLEERLADATIYSDQDRVAELTQLIQEQADKKAEIQALEWSWLDASEALEKAD